MKKSIVFSLLIAFGFLFSLSTFAQAVGSASVMTGNGVVISGSATVACSIKVQSSYKAVSIQAVVAKTSGTIAGTVTLQGSLDGLTYETVNTALVAGAASTYTATDVASQGKTFVVTGSPYLYYKLSYTGTGTMVGTLSGFVLPRN